MLLIKPFILKKEIDAHHAAHHKDDHENKNNIQLVETAGKPEEKQGLLDGNHQQRE